MDLSWRDVMAHRLARHHLVQAARHPLRVARDLCGVHAQLLSSAELALAARTQGLARGAVDRLLWDERALVKTWGMRGTLHLFAARDLPLFSAALSEWRGFFRPAWLRWYGLTLEEIERVLDAIPRALDGRELTRVELAREVARLARTPHAEQTLLHGWGMLLKPAAFRGLLCFAKGQGARVRFAAPPSQAPFRGLAMPEIARRYLRAYGPATRLDFQRWWGRIGVREAEAALREAGGEVRVEGVAAFAVEPLEGGSLPVRLLPAFDPLVVASSPHAGHLMPPGLRARVYRPQGWISPVLLVEGRFAGVWRHEAAKRVRFEITPFVRIAAAARRAAEEEAARVAQFLGGAAEVRWVSA